MTYFPNTTVPPQPSAGVCPTCGRCTSCGAAPVRVDTSPTITWTSADLPAPDDDGPPPHDGHGDDGTLLAGTC